MEATTYCSCIAKVNAVWPRKQRLRSSYLVSPVRLEREDSNQVVASHRGLVCAWEDVPGDASRGRNGPTRDLLQVGH